MSYLIATVLWLAVIFISYIIANYPIWYRKCPPNYCILENNGLYKWKRNNPEYCGSYIYKNKYTARQMAWYNYNEDKRDSKINSKIVKGQWKEMK